MFFYPMFRTTPKAFVRILHAIPDAPAVDIYANNNPLVKNLKYKEFTEYLDVPPGMYNIKVYPAGTMSTALIDTNLNLSSETISTVAAIGRANHIQLLPINDPILPRDPSKTYVRFAHISPNTPAVDITLPDGTVIFEDVEFKEVTEYAAIAPGRYTLQARPTGTSDVALTVPNILLKSNKFYTVYAVGLIGENPPLQVLIPLDGNTYIEF